MRLLLTPYGYARCYNSDTQVFIFLDQVQFINKKKLGSDIKVILMKQKTRKGRTEVYQTNLREAATERRGRLSIVV